MTSLPQDLSCYSGPPAVTVSHSRLTTQVPLVKADYLSHASFFAAHPSFFLSLYILLFAAYLLWCAHCSAVCSTFSALAWQALFLHAHRMHTGRSLTSLSYQPLLTNERLLTGRSFTSPFY